LSLSGYFFLKPDDASANAIDFESVELDFLREDAQDNNRIIIIGFAESKGNKIFNSAGLFFPDRTLNCVYRKTHLFYKEIYAFDRGDTGFFVVSFS
jgi:predicted amidohydrolase